MNMDWGTLIPMWISQALWVTVIITTVLTAVRVMLRGEADRLRQAMLPLLRKVESSSFIAQEQTTMTVTDLQKIMTKQNEQTEQVDKVPDATADKVMERATDSKLAFNKPPPG